MSELGTRQASDGGKDPFPYLGRDVSLDLVNTVDWTSRGLVNERLTGYEELTRWAEGAGLLTSLDRERLRRAALRAPRSARIALERGLRLRSVIQRVCSSIASGHDATGAWDAFNRELGAVLPHLRVSPRKSRRGRALRAEWAWDAYRKRLDSMLWPVIWSAARLVASDDARRIRVCAGPDCGWMYVDRSRNGLRRWCRMETCGTEEKSRRRRERLGKDGPARGASSFHRRAQ